MAALQVSLILITNNLYMDTAVRNLDSVEAMARPAMVKVDMVQASKESKFKTYCLVSIQKS